MLSVQSPTTSLCQLSSTDRGGKRKERDPRAESGRNNYTALRENSTCVTPVNMGPWQDREWRRALLFPHLSEVLIHHQAQGGL